MLRVQIISALVVSTLFSPVSAGESAYGPVTYDTGSANQFTMEAMLDITNKDRRDNGAQPLTIDVR